MSKRAILLWTFDYAMKHPETISIAINPGSLLDTKMVREAFGHVRSSVNKGTIIIVKIVESDNLKEYSGTYYDNDSSDFRPAHPSAYEPSVLQKLIEQTEKALLNMLPSK